MLLKNDDKEAFAEIYNRYKSVLQHHVYKKLGNFEEVKDVLQELFAQLWIKRKELPETTNLSGYLYVAIRNKVLNIVAHRNVSSKYVASLQQFINAGSEVTDLHIREKEFAEMIEKEINALPTKMQMVFQMSRKAHLSHKEIAIKLDISEQTVAKQITNAIKILRVKLTMLFLF